MEFRRRRRRSVQTDRQAAERRERRTSHEAKRRGRGSISNADRDPSPLLTSILCVACCPLVLRPRTPSRQDHSSRREGERAIAPIEVDALLIARCSVVVFLLRTQPAKCSIRASWRPVAPFEAATPSPLVAELLPSAIPSRLLFLIHSVFVTLTSPPHPLHRLRPVRAQLADRCLAIIARSHDSHFSLVLPPPVHQLRRRKRMRSLVTSAFHSPRVLPLSARVLFFSSPQPSR